MAKGFVQTGDPTVAIGEFKPLDNGFYRVNGINKFISADDNGEPVFSVNKYDELLKFSFEFRQVDGSAGPACNLTPADFYAMAGEFGVTLAGVTAKNRMSSSVLKDVIDKINASGKVMSVESKGGWVNYIPGSHYAGGLYTVKFIKALGNGGDDPYGFKNSNTGNYLNFLFEIVGDIQGKPSLWDGGKIWVYMHSPFVDSCLVNGELVTTEEAQCPLWQKDDKTGGDTPAVKKWKAFIKHFAPDVLEHDWSSDPLKSSFGINELSTPQTVIISYALSLDKHKVIYYDKAKKNYTFSPLDLDNLNSTEEPELEEVGLDDVEELAFDNAVVSPTEELIKYIRYNWPAVVIFDSENNFVDSGKDWAQRISCYSLEKCQSW